MNTAHSAARRWLALGTGALAGPVALILATSVHVSGQSAAAAPTVTFTKDVAPILQRSCQQCHNPGGGGPMSLLTYEEVRPWAKAIKTRVTIGPHRGVMPPWFLEKDIGIQKFKEDISLSDAEIARIVKWVDNGAPRGNTADMPAALKFDDSGKWTIGEPDLILKSKEITVAADAPDWWGDKGLIPTGLTEDRYVSAVEVREVNDIPRGEQVKTVGGRFVWHHQTYTSVMTEDRQEGDPELTGTSWPIHEVGRNADIFPPEAGRLMAARSSLDLVAAHIHANGRETKAHLEFGFKFFPKGYKPLYGKAALRLGNGMDVDAQPNTRQELHTYTTLTENTKIIAFEPHLHAQGVRMCIEAIWGFNVQTLNCVGYDHNWVKQYVYDDDYAPLLPKGTIIHEVGFLDTSAANKNMADNRNWTGGGRRSVANMFLDLGYSVSLTDEQFQEAMAKRRARMKSRNDFDIGCPICWAPPAPRPTAGSTGGQ
jgi:hypothetical protein